MSKLNRNRGKRAERSIAKYTGGQRLGIMGKEDVSCGPFSFEVKDFASFSGEKILAQAERNAPKGKTPVACVHIRGSRVDRSIVMMRLKEWWAWHGEFKVEGIE